MRIKAGIHSAGGSRRVGAARGSIVVPEAGAAAIGSIRSGRPSSIGAVAACGSMGACGAGAPSVATFAARQAKN